MRAFDLRADRGTSDRRDRSERRDIGRSGIDHPGARRDLLEDLAQVQNAWAVASVDIRRQILTRLAVWILVEAGEPARVEWRRIARLLPSNKP